MPNYVRPRTVYFIILIGVLCFLNFWHRRTFYGAFLQDSIIDTAENEDLLTIYADNDEVSNRRLQESGLTQITCRFGNYECTNCHILANNTVLVPLQFIDTVFELTSSVNETASTAIIKPTNLSVPSPSSDNHEVYGRYMFFDQYDVEKRPRVKLVLADQGVPLSVQWSRSPYPYPIQIAQFGLSHYSKWIVLKHRLAFKDSKQFTDPPVDVNLLSENIAPFSHTMQPSFSEINASTSVISFTSISSNNSLAFSARVPETEVYKSLWRYLVLSGENWTEGSYLKLRLRNMDATPVWKDIIYVCRNARPTPKQNPYLSFSPDGQTATFWMQECADAFRSGRLPFKFDLARDLHHDLQKAFRSTERHSHTARSQLSVEERDGWTEDLSSHSGLVIVKQIELYTGVHGPNGGGLLHRMYLGRPVKKGLPGHAEIWFHESRFLSAADWFLRNQREDGGWPTPVRRQIRGRPTIKPGWLSAMGQGQAISLLVRVFNYTNKSAYLESAQRALHPFERNVVEGGVRSYFLNQLAFPWFEEYPTIPGSHVLNGFIYALIGLYDLSQVSPNTPASHQAFTLWRLGVDTLAIMLPLFDSGTGSFYDLRHLNASDINSTASEDVVHNGPNRARWSYHILHIRQLYLLARLDSRRAVQWLDTAMRWTAYVNGTRSPHN